MENTTGSISFSGFTCGICGVWIPSGLSHSCTKSWKDVPPVITTYRNIVVLEDAERERLITAIVERVTAKILAELAGRKKRKMETRGPNLDCAR